MLFSSFTFLYVFLPLVLMIYYLTPRSYRNDFLLIASIVFYGWGEPIYLGMMLLIIAVNYAAALWIAAVDSVWARKSILGGAIVVDLAFLIYFKYVNFIFTNVQRMVAVDLPFLEIIMPIGISFYTFQAISYLVDVYRREVEPQRNIYDLGLYISFFPQLIAGPIVKYHDIADEIKNRSESQDMFFYGLRRFIVGLAKKIILANTLGKVVDQIFALDPSTVSVPVSWMGAVFYSLQLYFDFSGYSDMAIGLAALFGFNLLENFNYPYISKSITEFWRRWHISLSSWFKQYLYIPLGGNRVSAFRVYVNLFIVFLVTGIWHGAEWTFVVWGLFHGMFIIFEKLTGWHKERENIFVRMTQHGYLLFVACIGWVLFRAPNLGYAKEYLLTMFGCNSGSEIYYGVRYFLTNWVLFIFVIAIIAATGAMKKLVRKESFAHVWARCMVNGYMIVLLILSLMLLAGSTYNPFIYFRF